jgi:hypothetical protein
LSSSRSRSSALSMGSRGRPAACTSNRRVFSSQGCGHHLRRSATRFLPGQRRSSCLRYPPISIGRFRSTYTSRSVHPTLARGVGGIVAIEEVVAGQVFTGRRTSL